MAVALRTTLLLPLDDLLAVVRELLNPHVSRSGLDRCLRRHGVGNLRELKPKDARPTHTSFKAYEPGSLYIDIKYLPQMADEGRRRYATPYHQQLPQSALPSRTPLQAMKGWHKRKPELFGKQPYYLTGWDA